MEQSFIVESKTLQEALELASKQIGCKPEEIKYEVISHKKGFLGIGAIVQLKVYYLIDDESETHIDEKLFSSSINAEAKTPEVILRKKDGYCDITWDSRGIYLTVFPPENKGILLRKEQALDALYDMGIKNFLEILVEDIVLEKTGEPVKICEFDPSLSKDARVELFVLPSRMEASIKVYPPKLGSHVSESQIFTVLSENKIINGILYDEIKKICKEKIYDKKIVVAIGKDAVNGKNTTLDLRFNKKDTLLKPVEYSDGSVDFFELDLVNNVAKGEILAVKTPPTKGINGQDIYGNEIRGLDGKDIIRLTAGDNVKISDDGLRYISEIDGQVVMGDKNIKVLPVYTISGDVDFSTGNIDFIGSVFVSGNVLDNFSIKALNEVVVNGSVGASTIEAGQNISIRAGVVGKDKAFLFAGGSIKCKFVENSTLNAEEDIIIGRTALHSKLSAGNRVVTDTSKGSIVGGEVHAGVSVSAAVIGSPATGKMEIEVGVNPKIKVEYREVKEKNKLLSEELSELSRNIITLQSHIKQYRGKAPPEKLQNLNSMIDNKKTLESELESVQEKEQLLEEEISSAKDGVVYAYNKVFPKVTVNIAGVKKTTSEEYRHVKFIYEAGEIQFKPL